MFQFSSLRALGIDKMSRYSTLAITGTPNYWASCQMGLLFFSPENSCTFPYTFLHLTGTPDKRDSGKWDHFLRFYQLL